MNTKLIIAILCILLISIPCAMAGSLLAGSTIEVKSGIEGLSGNLLVGTWTTAPTASDYLYIYPNQIPANAGTLKETIQIDIPQPVMQQVFETQAQTPLYKVTIVKDTKWYWGLPFQSAEYYQNMCDQKITAYMQEKGYTLVPNVEALTYVGSAYCTFYLPVIVNQDGWIASLVSTKMEYKQDIILGTQGKLHLERSAKMEQLVDKIDGVGLARYVGANSWTNFPISEKDVYAYHGKNQLGADTWKPFLDTYSFGKYKEARDSITSITRVAIDQGTSANDAEYQLRLLAEQMNQQVDNIKINSATPPRSWASAADTSKIYSIGNTIYAPYNTIVFVPQIQIILVGERFGLEIPTGIPTIVSAQSKVSMSETTIGTLDYVVKNSATSGRGTFTLRAYCDGNKVTSEVLDISGLVAGQSKTGALKLTAKSTSFAPNEAVACQLEFKESTTQVADKRSFTINIVNKGQCAQNEEILKFNTDGSSTVTIVDTLCQTIDTKSCPATSYFKLVNGKYSCVVKDGGNDGGDGSSSVSTSLIWITIIASLAGAIWAYMKMVVLSRSAPKKYRNAILYGVPALVFVLLFFIIPTIAKVVVAFFTNLFTLW